MNVQNTPARREPIALSAAEGHAGKPGFAPEFTSFYRRYYKLVWHAAWKFGADESNVDDLVQETFVIALRRLPNFDARGPSTASTASTWLIKTLRYVMCNHQRGHARRVERHRAYTELAQRRHEESSSTERRLAERQLADFIEALEPTRRDVFILAEFGGYDSREIGETLSIKPGTVRTRLHAARVAFDATFVSESRGAVETELVGACACPPPPDAVRRGLTLQAVAVGGGQLVTTGGAAGTLALGGWLGKLLIVGVGLATSVVIVMTDLDVGHPRVAQRTVASPRVTPARSDTNDSPTKTHEFSSGLVEAIEVKLPAVTPAEAPPRADPDSAAVECARALGRARTEMLDSRPEVALDIIRKHSNWPTLSLRTQAVSLELGALCALARGAEAKARVESWRAENPDADLDHRVEKLCW